MSKEVKDEELLTACVSCEEECLDSELDDFGYCPTCS